jgi:hypothetical protein
LTDHLASRQTAGLGGDHLELNAKLDAIAHHFDLDWLMADGANPLQLLWRSQDAIASFQSVGDIGVATLIPQPQKQLCTALAYSTET